MKKWFILVATVILGLLMLTNSVSACEPCVDILDLEQTTDAADLIVIGRLVSEGPSTGSGPDWIEIEILEVWKGELDRTRIRVNSWDGMCAYGIILPDHEPHLIFLDNRGDMYDAVEYGCSVRAMLIQGDQVNTEDGQVPLDEFASSLGLSIDRAITPDPAPEPTLSWTPIVVGVVLILAMTAGFYWVLKRLARP